MHDEGNKQREWNWNWGLWGNYWGYDSTHSSKWMLGDGECGNVCFYRSTEGVTSDDVSMRNEGNMGEVSQQAKRRWE